MNFAVVNESSRVNETDLHRIVGACSRQLHDHVAPAWGLAMLTVTPHSSLSTVGPSATVVAVLDDADQADALGYHDETPDGRPYGRVFAGTVLDNGGTIADGPMSVSVTLSHELAEALVNPHVNLWADDGATGEIALEVGDPVENDAYVVSYYGRPVAVSNFVTPAWFDVQARGPFDHMGTVSKPRTMSRGGYTIVRTAGREGQRFASDVRFDDEIDRKNYPAWRTAAKLHPAARTARLLA